MSNVDANWLVNRIGRHHKSCPSAMTKAEVGALIVDGARRAGAVAIAEFGVYSKWTKTKTGKAKQRNIDYVWAYPAANASDDAAHFHGDRWRILAAFEIEGYPAAYDKSAPSKDADGLLSIRDVVASLHIGDTPIVATILFTVHPSGDRPWHKKDNFSNLAVSAASMRTRFAERQQEWIKKHVGTGEVPTVLDFELTTGKEPALDGWITAAGSRVQSLK